MAKPKGTDIVGWGLYSKVEVIDEIDVDQKKNAKRN